MEICPYFIQAGNRCHQQTSGSHIAYVCVYVPVISYVSAYLLTLQTVSVLLVSLEKNNLERKLMGSYSFSVLFFNLPSIL